MVVLCISENNIVMFQIQFEDAMLSSRCRITIAMVHEKIIRSYTTISNLGHF
ncbi:hypothetical protein MHIR_DE00169 [Candidatus Doolittlea endobia]|uniref:Uncharacterized protein n=1 Tax=Candidatus Doolittlea endobia TaxID=1778262 RepID=A0A143WRZ1_9ENTR|nr:hypothetical protein MHIR_DE00169 [Candidatus Doolittlea endobia]